MTLSTEPGPASGIADVDPESAALFRVGAALASELDLDRLVQRLTDEATRAVQAQLGAFFYNVTSDAGESYMLYALSGAPREAFDGFGMPRNTALFGTTFRADAVVRLDDVRTDPRYGKSAPHHGMPAGHPPVVSYLAVPVVARGTAGQVIGGLFFGHPEPARFTAREERIAVAVAAQAAVAIENAQLFRELRRSREEEAHRARRAAMAAEIGSLLTRGGALTETLRDCAAVLVRDEAIEVVRIWVQEGDELHMRASVGSGEPAERSGRVRPGEGPIGRVAVERRLLTFADVSQDALPTIVDESMRALAALPLETDDALVGVLSIRAHEPVPESVLESLRPIASLLALGIRRAEEQGRLRTSEVKHRLVADASNEGIWFWDVATNAVQWNERLLQILGLERAQWGGDFMAWFERVHPDDQPAMRAALDAHLARRGPYDVPRFRLRNASGEYRICSTRGQAEWDERGMPLHMAGAVADVTESVRAQEALATNEHRYRQILDSVRDMVFCKVPGSKVVYANAAACEHYGMSRDQLEGLVDSGANDPAFTAKYLDDDRAVFETGATVEDLDEPNRRHDGHLRFFHVVKSPVRDREGRIVELVGVARDVTERKRQQDDQQFLGEASSLLASSIEYEATLATVAQLAVPRFADWCAVDVLAEDGEIRRLAVTHVDPEKVELAHALAKRWPVDPAAERGVPEVIRSGRSEVHPEISDEVLQQIVTNPEQLAIIRELGLRSSMIVPLSAHGQTLGAITLVTAESGRVYDAEAIALAEDLAGRAAIAVENARLYASARRAVEARDLALASVQRFNVELERRVQERTHALAEANRELESFSYTVSHDLRAPIRHISGFVDLLAAHAEDRLDDKGRRWLRTIGDASKQMGLLIDALLAFSRMGRSELARERVDLDALVQEVLRQLEPDLQDRRIVWSLQPLPAVLGDRTMLRIVLTNLISNAVKYTRPRDEAHIEIAAGPGDFATDVTLWVRDDGVGFNMEYAHKLFGVFQRLQSSAEFEGTGIGLATVRRIVQRHGGRTWAEGLENRGATFYLTLPRAPDQTPPPALSASHR
ncbi:MAG: GAF domain-containing protein [Myxococcota bacterium]|nr:GAF domain-containing protein [Myxococcota bacterium]